MSQIRVGTLVVVGTLVDEISVVSIRTLVRILVAVNASKPPLSLIRTFIAVNRASTVVLDAQQALWLPVALLVALLIALLVALLVALLGIRLTVIQRLACLVRSVPLIPPFLALLELVVAVLLP